MTAKRRRTTQSFWLDVLRRHGSVQGLRRSAQHMREEDTLRASLPGNGETGNIDPQESRDELLGLESCVHTSMAPPDMGAAHGTAQVPVDNSAPCDFNPDSTPASAIQHEEFRATVAMNTDLPAVIDDYDRESHDCTNPSPTNGKRRPHPDLEGWVQTEMIRDQDDEDEHTEEREEFQPFDEHDGEHRTDPVPPNIQPVTPENRLPPQQILPTTPENLENNEENADVGNTESEESHIPDINDVDTPFHQLLQIWRSKLNLTAVVAVVGSVRYTVRQYDYTRDMLRDVGAEQTWPPYARTQRYFERLLETCLPKSVVLTLSKGTVVTPSARGDEHESSDSEDDCPDLDRDENEHAPDCDGTENVPECDDTEHVLRPRNLGTEKVRVFPPSESAKLDVATSVVFEQMYPSFYNDQHTLSALDCSAIIRDKEGIKIHVIASSPTGEDSKCHAFLGAGLKFLFRINNQLSSTLSKLTRRGRDMYSKGLLSQRGALGVQGVGTAARAGHWTFTRYRPTADLLYHFYPRPPLPIRRAMRMVMSSFREICAAYSVLSTSTRQRSRLSFTGIGNMKMAFPPYP